MIIHPHEQENNHMSDIAQNLTAVNVSPQYTDEEVEAINASLPEDPPEEALTPEQSLATKGLCFDDMTPEELAAFDKKVKENKKKPKFTQWDLIEVVTRAMKKDFLPEPWREFPAEYQIMQDERGLKVIFLIEEGQVLSSKDNEHLATAINRYVRSHSHISIFPTENVIKEIILNWKRSVEPLVFDSAGPKNVDVVRQKSTPGYTLQRLPWDLCDGPTPLFDNMMSRTSNSQALMDFIGSLFISRADRQTFVWIYGAGGDGKSSLLRVIEKAFGPSYGNEKPDFLSSNFWTSGIVGKRVVAFADLDDAKIIQNGTFKNLTGGDTLRVEYKRQTPIKYKSKAMVFCSSNEKPQITLQPADLRRIIYCEMLPPAEITPNFEKRLWEEEAQHFFYKCVRGYLTRYPHFTAIRPETDKIIEIAESQQTFNEMIFEKHFIEVKDDGKTAQRERAVKCTRIEEILKDIEKLQTRDINAFRKFLEKHKGFKRLAVKLTEGTKESTKCWVGFRELSPEKKPATLKHGEL